MDVPNNTDRAAWLQGPSASCLPTASPIHPWRLLLLGAPGVGKGTQADLLHQRLGACHLSTGDVFRSASSGCATSAALTTALSYMRRGDLVPVVTVWEMVRERSSCLRCLGGFILDGFPRTLPQAESLQDFIKNERIALDAVVNYELPQAEIVERLAGRRTCATCKAVYHLTRQPSRMEDVCDRCGGPLRQREDDLPEAIQNRMNVYEQSTAPLIQFYRNASLLLSIEAVGSPEQICTRTVDALEVRRREHQETGRAG